MSQAQLKTPKITRRQSRPAKGRRPLVRGRKNNHSPRGVWLSPADHGRTMTLAKFDRAEGEPGYIYELNRGVIEVMNIAGISHGLIIQAARDQFVGYRLERDIITYISAGSDCKLLLPGVQSERHPDVAVYLHDPPQGREQPWDVWLPAIVVEVVSPGQAARDYEDKRADYLAAGVLEYRIIDPQTQSMLVLQRSGDVWLEHRVKRTGTYRSHVLPGFEFNLKAVLAAGKTRS